MRIFSLLCLLQITTANAFAADFQPIAESEAFTANIDVASIKHVSGEIYESSFLFSYSTPQKSHQSGAAYQSALITSRFDCGHKKFAPYRRVEFAEKNKNGPQVATVAIPENKIRYYDIQPTSMNEIMHDAVCKICLEKAKK